MTADLAPWWRTSHIGGNSELFLQEHCPRHCVSLWASLWTLVPGPLDPSKPSSLPSSPAKLGALPCISDSQLGQSGFFVQVTQPWKPWCPRLSITQMRELLFMADCLRSRLSSLSPEVSYYSYLKAAHQRCGHLEHSTVAFLEAGDYSGYEGGSGNRQTWVCN